MQWQNCLPVTGTLSSKCFIVWYLDILPCENGLHFDSIIQKMNIFLTSFHRKVLYLYYICSLDYFLYFLNFVYDINFHIFVIVFEKLYFKHATKESLNYLLNLNMCLNTREIVFYEGSLKINIDKEVSVLAL